MDHIFDIDFLRHQLDNYVIPLGMSLLVAALIFFGGRMVARLVVRAMGKLLMRAKVEESLIKFLTDLAYFLLLAVIVIAALERLGVKTTAAIAVIGAAGLAVGLALQGSLGNFASGVLIMLLKPYKAGDLVKLSDHTGYVDSVKIFNTVLITPDSRTIIIPNGAVTSNTIENVSALGKIRIDMVFGISYSDDIDKAKKLLLDILKSDERVLDDPAPMVAVCELGDSSVNFVARPHVHPEDYWAVRFHVTEEVKKQFDAHGVSIPFPQRDIHMKQSQPAIKAA